jgi:hypothetical protein
MHQFTAGMLLLLLLLLVLVLLLLSVHLLRPRSDFLRFPDPTKCRLSTEWLWLLRRTVLSLLRGEALRKVVWEDRICIRVVIGHRS